MTVLGRLFVAQNSSPPALIYEQDTAGVLTFQANLDSDATGGGAEVHCSLDGVYAILRKRTGTAGQGVQIFQKSSGYSYSQIFAATNPSTSSNTWATISADGSYAAYSTSANAIHLLKRDVGGSSYTDIRTISFGANVRGLAISPNNKYLVVGFNATNEGFSVYRINADTTVTLVDQVVSTHNGGAPILTDAGAFEVLLGETSSSQIFERTKAPSLVSTAYSTTSSVSGSDSPGTNTQSLDLKYVAGWNSGGSFIPLYKRNGFGSYSALTSAAAPASSTPRVMELTPTAEFLNIGLLGSPYLAVYSRSGDAFTQLADPATLPTSAVNGIAFAPNYAVTLGYTPEGIGPADTAGFSQVQSRLSGTAGPITQDKFTDANPLRGIAGPISGLFQGSEYFYGFHVTLRNDAGSFSGQAFTHSEWLSPSLTEAVSVGDQPATDVIHVIHERVVVADKPTSSLHAIFSVVEHAAFADALVVARNLLINEGITFTDAVTVKRNVIAAIVEAMVLHESVSSQLEGVSLLSVALALNESYTAAFGLSLVEALQVDDSVAAKWVGYATAIESVLVADTATMKRTAVLALPEHLTANDTVSATASLVALLYDEIEFEATLVVDGLEFDAWAVNSATGAPSQYDNFNFDSMCRLGDRYYGAGDNGLFLLDGADDDGDPIQASILTGELDFGSPNLKRCDYAHIGVTSAGDLVLKVTTTYRNDAGDSVKREDWYRAVKAAGIATEQRLKIGKALKSQYWQFEILNTQGKELDLDRINLRVLELSRRV